MDVPSQTAQWTLSPGSGVDGLRYHESSPITPPREMECLVRLEAVSLNYRDVAMSKGIYPMPVKDDMIPCSDGAGVIVAIGPAVTRFKVGDKVCTLFFQDYQSGHITMERRKTSLGAFKDGVLRQYAVFNEQGLIATPKTLTLVEASTLSCAALTAWNALYGLESRSLKRGDFVLTQGTGGVSLFAIQIALAAGATVVATTSSDEKAARLKLLGVQHVLNYTKDQNWGTMAKQLSPNGAGVDQIIEVGGETSMAQSLKAIRPEGVISVIGFLGGKESEPQCSFGDVLMSLCILRGVSVGPAEQFEAMRRFIDTHDIKPIVHERVFRLKEAKEAYELLWNQKQWGKVVITPPEG